MSESDYLQQTIRECCRDDEAFERLQQLLVNLPPVSAKWVTATPIPTDETAFVPAVSDRLFLVQRLRQAEAQYRSIFESISDGLVINDPDTGTVVEVNPAFCRMHGYSREEFLGMPPKRFIHPDSYALFDEYVVTVKAGRVFRCRAKEIRKDGSLFYIEVMGTQFQYLGKAHLLAVVRDITDQVQAEQLLKASEARNRALVDAIPDFMFRLHRDGTCLDVKVARTDSLILPTSANIGKNIQAVLPSDVAQRWMHHIQQALQTGEVQNFEYQIVIHGSQRDREARMVVSGEQEVVAIMRDITDRKRIATQQAALYEQVQSLNASLEQQVLERTAELQQKMQELQELSQQKDDFLHAVSHDLRTPMMGMLLVLKNLQKKEGDTIGLSRSILDRMVHSSERQLEMIHSLLEAHSSQVQGVFLSYESVNLGALVSEIVADLEPLLTESQATLTNAVLHDLPIVTVDRAQIWRVFDNLLTNALKHNPPNVHITLQATIDAEMIRCSVHDNGRGMTQHECDSLFERYARGTQARRTSGIGLGLYLCRQIITAHGGQIGAISNPGQGATFWFTLPLAEP